MLLNTRFPSSILILNTNFLCLALAILLSHEALDGGEQTIVDSETRAVTHNFWFINMDIYMFVRVQHLGQLCIFWFNTVGS